MNITKDEARILVSLLDDGKYDIVAEVRHDYKDKIFQALSGLQSRLKTFSIDKRRNGRRSLNDFTDLLERYSKVK